MADAERRRTGTNQASPLRFGLIGSGMMGIEHILNLRLIPEVLLVAFADPNETSRKWASR